MMSLDITTARAAAVHAAETKMRWRIKSAFAFGGLECFSSTNTECGGQCALKESVSGSIKYIAVIHVLQYVNEVNYVYVHLSELCTCAVSHARD
jgi:hypothetical protein